MQISLQDFSIHRIIGRGGFGEVYGCRKDDSGKMLVTAYLLSMLSVVQDAHFSSYYAKMHAHVCVCKINGNHTFAL